MKNSNTNFKVGDRVRVVQRRDSNRRPTQLGETLWEITHIASNGFSCKVREAGVTPALVEQPFDLSLLYKVEA